MADDENFALQPTARRRAKPRERMTAERRLLSENPTARLYGRFQVGYAKQWGIPLILNERRDQAILKELESQLGEELVASLIAQFFDAVRPVQQGGDPVVSRSRFSNLPDFKYHAQYLLLQRSRGPALAERTASNVHEIGKAMGLNKEGSSR